MSGDISAREAALRRLPLPYSLALRLRDFEVAAEIICEYLGIQENELPGLYLIAEEKLAAVDPGPAG